ncbi:MAG: TonB-dependent receptor [Bacteroidetes bacterium]|nr:TonB-dependent receptor [Bacteroidota bacterium]
MTSILSGSAKYFITLTFALYSILLCSQGYSQSVGDTLRLPEFEISSKYILDNSGFKRVKIDSSLLINHLNADLSNILSQYSTIFIKSYGNGSLATPSFRGTTSRHTQVEWNGVKLNSPMLGEVDLSQIPVSQFDGLEILYGAAGISRTTGAFGGVINLVTNPDWNNRLNILTAASLGSFYTYTTNVNVVAGTSSFQSHTKFNYSSSSNGFPYFNDYLKETIRQQSAAFALYGMSEELFWKLKDKHLISVKFRYNENDHNLPPTASNINTNHLEKQKENLLLTVIEYKFVEKKYNLLVRSAFSDQKMHYILDSSINNTHRYSQWINKIRLAYFGIRNLTIKPGIDFTYDQVNSDAYNGTKFRATTSLFSEFNYEIGKNIKTSLVIREDLIDGKFLPVVPALGIEFLPWNKFNLSFTLNLARNYKYPTLNDLYWNISGNPDLKPETNYSIEIGSAFNHKSKDRKFFFEFNLAGYYSWIYQMITWSPVNGSSIWKPENIDEILARGLETGLNFKWEILRFLISLDNNYNFCRSTYQKASSAYDQKIGKQLIYIPVHTLNSTLNVERWKFYLNYNFYYVSDRFTAKDNLSIMPGYYLSNIIFGKNIGLKKIVLSLQIQINNIFNLDYQAIPDRPMPGINYAFTLKLAFPNSAR